MDINQVLSLVRRRKAKEGRTPPLNANISQEKILPWGLMALRESDLNGYYAKGIFVTFRKRAGFEGGERETDLLVHAH